MKYWAHNEYLINFNIVLGSFIINSYKNLYFEKWKKNTNLS